MVSRIKRYILLALVITLALLPPQTVALAETQVGASLSVEEQDALAELFALNRHLERLTVDLKRTTDQESQVRKDMAILEREQGKAQEQLERRRHQYAKRLRYYHEQGTFAPVAIILQADSLKDLVDRVYMFNLILKRDSQVLADLRSLGATLLEQEQQLAQQQNELARLAEAQRKQHRELQNEVDRKERLLADLRESRAAVEAELAALERSWERTALPVLMALGAALEASQTQAIPISPDRTELRLFPPGARAFISANTFTNFFRAQPGLGQLGVSFQGEQLVLAGRLDGADLEIVGRFQIDGKSKLRFTPESVIVMGFTIEPGYLTELTGEDGLIFDLSEMIGPLSLKNVSVVKSELIIDAGL